MLNAVLRFKGQVGVPTPTFVNNVELRQKASHYLAEANARSQWEADLLSLQPFKEAITAKGVPEAAFSAKRPEEFLAIVALGWANVQRLTTDEMAAFSPLIRHTSLLIALRMAIRNQFRL